MDIKQMKYFLEICKYGSISQAARSLFISQQGLSSAIRRLEGELNCDLFYRKGNSLVLTEQGKYFMEKAGEIVASCNRLQNHFTFAGASAEHISVACVYNIISKSLAALQHLLIGGDSGMDISVGECYSDECAGYLERNECNFAISYDLEIWSGELDITPLFRVEHCFIVHKDHPLAEAGEITLEQLDGMRMIFPIQKTAIRVKLDRMLRERGVRPNVVFQTNQALQIYDLISNDHSLVARVTLDDARALDNTDIRILRLRGVDFSTSVVLLHRKDQPLTMVERLFRQDVLSAIQKPN